MYRSGEEAALARALAAYEELEALEETDEARPDQTSSLDELTHAAERLESRLSRVRPHRLNEAAATEASSPRRAWARALNDWYTEKRKLEVARNALSSPNGDPGAGSPIDALVGERPRLAPEATDDDVRLAADALEQRVLRMRALTELAPGRESSVPPKASLAPPAPIADPVAVAARIESLETQWQADVALAAIGEYARRRRFPARRFGNAIEFHPAPVPPAGAWPRPSIHDLAPILRVEVEAAADGAVAHLTVHHTPQLILLRAFAIVLCFVVFLASGAVLRIRVFGLMMMLLSSQSGLSFIESSLRRRALRELRALLPSRARPPAQLQDRETISRALDESQA